MFAIMDFTKGLTHWEQVFDIVIYVIFVIDYVVRFVLADKKKDFFKSNILDLIAIVPFNSAFRIFRTLKIFRMTKMLKLVRISSVSARGLKKTKRFFNTNGFKYVLMLTATSIVVGAILMTQFEQMSFQDALWWSFVTATTVGYGDLSPATGAGRIIASCLMLVGIGLIGSLTSSITSFFLHEEPDTKCSSDKVEMVKTMYESLNDEEKELFKQVCLTVSDTRQTDKTL